MDDYDKSLHRSRLFAGLIYSGCRMGAWCFGIQSRTMHYTTSPNEQELLMFLAMSGCLDYIFSDRVDKARPVLLSDSLGMLWAADYAWQDGRPNIAIVIGPVFSSASSQRGIGEALRRMNFSMRVRKSLEQILDKVPVVSIPMLYQYTAMLHYALTEEILSREAFQFQHLQDEAEEEGTEQADGEAWSLSERVSLERIRAAEEELLQLVREGNPDDFRRMEELSGLAGSDGFQAGAPERNQKNALLIFAALCARAAMEGGLPPRMAKDMEAAYLTKIEQAKTVTELMHIREIMLEDFVKGVHQCRSHPEISAAVQECCSYIQKNLQKPLALGEIAREVGYTEYYLTRKFYREMGVRLSDYIKDCRIERSKIWLLTTQRSIQEISEQLQFGTRTYFSKVFRKKVGMTPAAYRARAAAPDGGEDRKGRGRQLPIP